MKDHPWLKFYPQDWMGEPRLRACSIAARGLWIEMISLAHQATPYGHVLVNGNVPDIAMLARMCSVGESECEALLQELDQNGVFSRTRKGVIYSRRMIKDAKKASHARSIGKRGGNPSLSKQKKNQDQDNPKHKGVDKPHIPEARSQSPETRKEKRESPLQDSEFSRRATRLPPDWSPTSDLRTWAFENTQLCEEEIARETDKFRDYWAAVSGQRATKRDWSATWRNWIRKAEEYRASRGGGLAAQGRSLGGRQASGGIVAIARDIMAEGDGGTWGDG